MKTSAGFLLLLILMQWGYCNMALAHKVIVFAWVEDGIIHVEGSFGGNNKVHSGSIEVSDAQGQRVFTGLTNENGYVSFGVPDGVDSDLTVVLDAGTAHKAQWKIPKEELVRKTTAKTGVNRMETRKQLEESPSMVNVIAGIGIIFFVAFAVQWIRKRKTPAP